MRHKRLLAACSVVVILAVLFLVAAFFVLQSASSVNAVARALEPYSGYRVHVDRISVDRHLHADVRGVEIQRLKGDPFHLRLAAADIKGKVAAPLTIEIEHMSLDHPKFTFQMKKEKASTNPFAALEKLPPLRLLEVRDGELVLKGEGAQYTVPGVNLTVRNFSAKKGGDLSFRGRLNVKAEHEATTGGFEGSLSMSRFSPDPHGRGSITLILDSGSFGAIAIDKARIASKITLEGDRLIFRDMLVSAAALMTAQGRDRPAIKDIRGTMNVLYDQKTSRFALTALKLESAAGSLQGQCEGTVKPLSWVAVLDASSVNVSQVFAFARPFLPEEYRSWTFKGQGGLSVKTEGRMSDPAMWKADAVVDLREGGFASPDNLKAGERITGKVRLKIASPEKEKKGQFDVSMDAGDGEFLWGKFYRDFKGQTMTVSGDGSFMQSPFSLSGSGVLDFFGSGRYAFSADMTPQKKLFTFEGSNVSHKKLYAILLSNYVQQNYQDMQDLDMEGASDMQVTATMSGDTTTVRGRLSMRGAAVRVPSRQFSLAGVEADIPFDFSLPPATSTAPLDAEQGFVSFASLEAGKFALEGKKVPLLVSRNTVLVPTQIDVPLYGGDIRITHLRFDRIFSPLSQMHAGIAVNNLDLGIFTETLAPIPINGTITGALPSIVVEGGKWRTKGKIVAKVFGGTVEFDKLHADRLFRTSRLVGADITFEDIDLEALTNKIKVGRITGVVKGYARNFFMEYGQPAGFDLKVETDRTKKTRREISVEAIENLSIVSTGIPGISSALNRGINRFFKQYAYRGIGIECTLVNDVFRVRGTIREGGKEYLIKRPLFHGIDVVNQNPDNEISFKDMQERVSRIFRPRQETKDVS